MPNIKYPIFDPMFRTKMLSHCETPWERGLIKVLLLTGMHTSVVADLTPENLERQGELWVLKWRRVKNQRWIDMYVPSEDLEDIKTFVSNQRKYSRQHIWGMVQRIGDRAGFTAIAPLTFRHQKCYELLEKGYHTAHIANMLGCTEAVVIQNYGRLLSYKEMLARGSVPTTPTPSHP